MKLNHPELVDLLKMAYSAEKAAAFAYQGHAGSVKDLEEKKNLRLTAGSQLAQKSQFHIHRNRLIRRYPFL